MKETPDYWRGMHDGYMKAIKEIPNMLKEMSRPTIIVCTEEQKKKIMEDWNNG